MTIQKLFFQLIQVSIGQLDCLDRGPSPEEWQELYNLSKQHQLATVCYDGVVRLFDFGLRAPQDLSIDWMAETEDTALQAADAVPAISHPLRRKLVERWTERNGSSLYQRNSQPEQFTPSAAVVVLLLRAFEDFHRGELKLDAVVALCQQLRQANGVLPEFRDDSSVEQMLQTFGIWNFTKAMMWMAGEVTALDPKLMPAKPDASRGRFVLEQVWGGKVTLSERIKNRIRKLLLF